MVYDTLAERNPAVLKTCRRYLHWVQRSVFQGELSAAQYRRLTTDLQVLIDTSYDSIRVYRTHSPQFVETLSSAQNWAMPSRSSNLILKAVTCPDA